MVFFCVPTALMHKLCLWVEGVRQLDVYEGTKVGVSLGTAFPVCPAAAVTALPSYMAPMSDTRSTRTVAPVSDSESPDRQALAVARVRDQHKRTRLAER